MLDARAHSCHHKNWLTPDHPPTTTKPMTEQFHATASGAVYHKLMQARIALQGKKLTKTGHNKFAGYKYFELGDFLPATQEIFLDIGLCGYVTFTTELAILSIVDTGGGGELQITSPMATASLKGAHDIQNLGAVQTYLRRYLWVTAMEIVEHDALDATLGNDAPAKRQQRTSVQPAAQPAKQQVAKQPVQSEPALEEDDDTNAFVSAMYEKMSAAGMNSIGIKTLLTVVAADDIRDIPVKLRSKVLTMMTPDYAKLLNSGKNSKGQQVISLPDEENDAPSIDELQKEADELF